MPSRILRPRRAQLAAGFLALLVTTGVVSAAPAHAAGGAVPDSSGTAHAPSGNDEGAVEALRRVVTAESAYVRAKERNEFLRERVRFLGIQASDAAKRAERLSAHVDDSTARMLLDAVTSFVTGDQSEVDLAVAAVEDERFALEILRIAEQGLTQAELDVSDAKKELARARADVAEVRTRAAAMEAARTAIERAQFNQQYDVDDRGQDRRNRRALEGWTDYLIRLGRAGVVPPHAEALADPDHLVGRFEPVHDRRGRRVVGVAEIDTADGPLRVVPAETVRAVSTAFSRVGLPAADDARKFTCGGLAAQAWEPTALGVPTTAASQWRTLAAVPVGARQIGDLLYTDSDGIDPSVVAVVVADNLMVTADPTTGVSAVETIDRRALRNVIGVRRATLPEHAGLRGDPPSSPDCQRPVSVSAPSGPTLPGSWAIPVPAGYAASTPFGVSGPLWSSGQHTGLDFAAPTGTPVHAARGGTVSIERPDWAGRLVRIDHGDGMETWYAHLSAVDVVPGQQVRPGTRIGAVGSAGNTTGPHLHFEVRVEGIATDPATALGLAGSS